MAQVYDSTFQRIDYDQETQLLKVTRKPATDEMEDEEYKSELKIVLAQVLTKKVRSILMDEQDFNFPIIPELQLWIANEIFPPAIGVGVQKLAFIKSADLFVNISVEQAMGEVKIDGFAVKYFDNEADALIWAKN